MTEKIAIIGLGYVGLPVAVSLAKHFDTVIGFDIDTRRIDALKNFNDVTGEIDSGALKKTNAHFTHDPSKLNGATFFIVTVPTPIDAQQRPDLTPLIKASETIAPHLKKGALVVYESTVYPGVTEDVCGPVLEKLSGLKSGVDFFLGYSPERINPGDTERTFETIIKIVAAQDDASLQRVVNVYGKAVTAGLHQAPSIKVAEAAKVIENTQRDLNIALMNELAMIFHRVGISTKDVLAAAGTKWNFLKFTPGLVGGHCIGVDPYYLTTEAERLGYYPHLILAGRRINDGMGIFIAEAIVKKMIASDLPVKRARVGILGLTFKENVPDLRNSRVPDILRGLDDYGMNIMVHDPHADPYLAQEAYGLSLTGLENIHDLDVLVLAVAHNAYTQQELDTLLARLKPNGLFVDIKSVFSEEAIPEGHQYWAL